MAKRRKAELESEDDWHHSSGQDDSDEEFEPSDASYGAKTRSKRVNPRKFHTAAPKRRKVEVIDTEVASEALGASQHSKKTHVISNASDIRLELLRWFDGVRDTRGMPWRKPFDRSHNAGQLAQRAYEVWISEIMLQQTQVVTVIPYYNRWMSKFPTIHDLAKANIEGVNALWKGLGYYSRASRLLSGAQKVVAELDGLLPHNAKDMEAKIPGIGRYSAGAICSIAYGEKAPVLDGNVNRLLSRFLRLHANPKAKGTLDILWAAAEAMVQVKGSPKDVSYQNPGDINQALIELGSTICRVRDPDCVSCPLKTWCGAYKHHGSAKAAKESDVVDIEDACGLCEPLLSQSSVTSFPMKVQKKKAREETDIVNVVEWRSGTGPNSSRKFLLVKRPEKGLLAGLHEFPTLSNAGSPTRKDMDRIPLEILSQLLHPAVNLETHTSKPPAKNLDSLTKIVKTQLLGDVIHVFSHVRKTYRTQWVVLEGGEEAPRLKILEPGVDSNASLDKEITARQRSHKKAVTQPAEHVEAKWVAEDDVSHENTSTGVVKVWKLAQSFWAAEESREFTLGSKVSRTLLNI